MSSVDDLVRLNRAGGVIRFCFDIAALCMQTSKSTNLQYIILEKANHISLSNSSSYIFFKVLK
jgi:hypothetical protein